MGDLDREEAPAAEFAFHSDRAAMRLHDPARDGEAEPEAGRVEPDRPRRVRVHILEFHDLREDALEVVARDSNARVRDADLDAVHRLTSPDLDRTVVGREPNGVERQV